MWRHTILNSCLFLSLLSFIPGSESIDCAQRNKSIRSLRTRLSGFMSRTQYITVLEQIEDEIYNLTSADDILTKFPNQVLDAMNTQQKMTVLSKGSTVCQETGLTANELLEKIGNVLYNNLYGFMNQTVELSGRLQEKKQLKKDSIVVISYRKLNQFILKSIIEGVICRLVDNFTPGQWESVYNNFNSIFIFNYTCAIPN